MERRNGTSKLIGNDLISGINGPDYYKALLFRGLKEEGSDTLEVRCLLAVRLAEDEATESRLIGEFAELALERKILISEEPPDIVEFECQSNGIFKLSKNMRFTGENEVRALLNKCRI